MKKILLTLFIFATLFGANIVHAENLIQGGTFENVTESDFTKNSENKITAVKNNSVHVKWKGTSWILGFAGESFSGEKALHIKQTGGYYPVTFKAELERGNVYKFSARVKSAIPSTSFNANLCVSIFGVLNSEGKEKDYSDGTDIKALVHNDLDSLYKIENPWSTVSGSYRETFTDSEWKLFERYIYVAPSTDPAAAQTLAVHMGLAHGQYTEVEYYIDDVSLTKVDPAITMYDGYSKVYAAKGKDMVYTYKAQSYTFTQGEISWSLEGDTTGASIDNSGNLTIGEEASGNITVVASASNGTVTCIKEVEIVPFTADNITVNVNGKPLNGFSVGNENYVYEYRGDTAPTVTATGNQSIIENENTVFVNDTTKTYDIIFKKLPDFNENLFYDGGFEEGVVYPEQVDFVEMAGTYTTTTDAQYVRSGRYAMEVEGKAGTVFTVAAPGEPGKLYALTMWVKNSSASSARTFYSYGYTSTTGAVVEYYDETKNSFYANTKTSTSTKSYTFAKGGDWTPLTVLLRVSGDVSSATMKFGFYTTSAATYYIDDVSVYELDMSELDGAYMSAIYRTANGEIAKTITDAERMELILYNPQFTTVDTNLLIAEYEDGRLLNLTKEQFTSSELVKIENKPLTLQEGTNSMSVLAWDTGFAPDIKSANIK